MCFGDTETLEEIRVKCGGNTVIRRSDENIVLDLNFDEGEFSALIDRMCRGSFYSYAERIRHGFIPLGDGFRCGLCGGAVVENGVIKSIYPVNGLVLRIPRRIRNLCGEFSKLIRKGTSLLIYGRPGEGKTTVLRDLIFLLSNAPMNYRVSVIDSGDEIVFSDTDYNALVNVYGGFPKSVGMTYALCTMSPDFIICDEIGTESDSKAVLSCSNAGVGIIATAHSSDFNSLIRRSVISILYRENVFDYYIGIKRTKRNTFIFNITKGE